MFINDFLLSLKCSNNILGISILVVVINRTIPIFIQTFCLIFFLPTATYKTLFR